MHKKDLWRVSHPLFNTVMWKTDSLHGLQSQFTEKQADTIMEMIQFYIKEYKKASEGPNMNPQSVAYAFNSLIDRLIAEHQSDPSVKNLVDDIACSNGCNYCCKMYVGITRDEALLLKEHSKEIGFKINKTVLTIQSKCESKDWKKLKAKHRACIFLDDNGSCSVYEYRPINCRKYFVLETNKFCSPRKVKYGKAKRLVSPKIEAVASAILNAVENDSMPKMLLEVL